MREREREQAAGVMLVPRRCCALRALAGTGHNPMYMQEARLPGHAYGRYFTIISTSGFREGGGVCMHVRAREEGEQAAGVTSSDASVCSALNSNP